MRIAAAIVLAAITAFARQCDAIELTRPAPKATVYLHAPTQAVVYDSRPELGIGMHEISSRALDMVQQLGIRLVRHTMYWNRMETTEKPGLYDGKYLSDWDAITEECRRRGVYLVVVVHGDPPGVSYENREEAYQRYARFVADMAARYTSVIYWELFNEMDSGFTCLFGANDNVGMRERGANYARMLKIAYPAIRAANPAAWVLCGGMSDTEEFTRGVYEAGGGPFFDIMSIHTYGVPAATAFVERGKQIRALMAEYGDGDKPLWNTEFGLDAGGVVGAWGYPHDWNPPQDDAAAFDQKQLEDYQNCLKMNSQLGLYQKVLPYQFRAGNERDDTNDIRSRAKLPEGMTIDDYGFGIVRRDLSPRPTYKWLLEAKVNSAILDRPRSSFSAAVSTRTPMAAVGYDYKETPGGIEIHRVVVDSLVPTRIDLVHKGDPTAPKPGRKQPAAPEPRKGTRPIPDPHDI